MDGDKYVFLFIDCLAGWGWLDLQDGWIELARRGVAGIDLRACESLGNYCQMIRFSKTHLIRFSFSKSYAILRFVSLRTSLVKGDSLCEVTPKFHL